jgi:hypothetical protein
MKRRTFCKTTLIGSTALALRPACPLAAEPQPSPQASTVVADVPAIKLAGQSTVIEKAALEEFSASLRGNVILAGHPEYDAARRIWNAMIDKRPAMIVRCAGAADVANAVTFARERELLVAVRGGGHSHPGYSTCDGGMVIDLSPMRTVRVDPKNRVATVAAGAWGRDVDTETQHYGLATCMGQISDTGCAGLTLGGGFSWLSRQFALACDNLKSVDLVSADGQLRHVSTDENADLFWGIRGGGGNFGVVTSFDYRLHAVAPKVIGGHVTFPAARAREVLEFYSGFAASTPRELSSDFSLGTVEGASIYVCYAGDLATGMKVLEPLLRLSKPIENTIGPQTYLQVQRQFDGPHLSPTYHYLKGGFLREFAPGLIDLLADDFRPGEHFGVYMQNSSGAVGDIEPTATAFWNRNTIVNLMLIGDWPDPADNERNRAFVRATWEKIAPFTAGFYVNLGDADKRSTDRNFGPNHARLVALKRKYDPGNLFRLNSNIRPDA